MGEVCPILIIKRRIDSFAPSERKISMFNPPNSYQSSGSFDDILKRLTKRIKQNEVDRQILEMLQRVFELELDKENVVLSRPERVLLYQKISTGILADVLGKIGGTK
jgi:hypothetical protein